MQRGHCNQHVREVSQRRSAILIRRSKELAPRDRYQQSVAVPVTVCAPVEVSMNEPHAVSFA
jgi:hypothetical protein